MAANSKSSAKKPTKGKKRSPEVELAAAHEAIKSLRETVAKLEKSVGKLEDRFEKRVSELKSEAKKLRAAAEQAGRSAVASARGVGKSAPQSVSTSARQVSEPEPAPAAVVPVEETPKAELTVAQLRVVARTQSVAGYSRMTKAQLVDALQH